MRAVNRSMNEYARIVEKATGVKIRKVYVPEEELKAKLAEGNQPPMFIVRAWAASTVGDFTHTSHVELLNPGEDYWKPKLLEEVVKAQHCFDTHSNLTLAP